MVTLRFDWPAPPLSANRDLHWAEKARLTRDIRLAARLASSRIGPQRRVEVTMVWIVADKRRRDVDNIVPTLKPICDGIVDAGVVRDDTPEFMVKGMPRIVFVKGAVPHVLVEVTPIV